MTQRHDNFIYTKRIAKRYGLRRAFTFWSIALLRPRTTSNWIRFVRERWSDDAVDGMVLRALRPYMRQNFKTKQRCALLRTHYETMETYFAGNAVLRREPGVIIATLTGKNDATYDIYFGGNTSKEGELSFGIYNADGHYLAKMSAAIGRDENDQPVLWLGGLQGAKPPMGRDDVVKATKDLFGLRPKGAVLLAAQCFAKTLGLTAIRAPGNEGHISQRGIDLLKLNKRKIYADYGQFWEEIGGTKIADEEYSIPVVPQVRDVSDVKPHKRSEWKKRQALSELLAMQATGVLTTLQTLSEIAERVI